MVIRETWGHLRARPAGLLALFVFVALFATSFSTLGWSASTMRQTQLDDARQPPTAKHWLGTDDLGRDLAARLLYGGAISLSLGLLAAVIAVSVGTTYGAIAGYVGGRVDEWMMRAVDVLFALPSLLLLMLLTASLGARLEQVPLFYDSAAQHWRSMGREWSRFIVLAVAIGGVSWLSMARVVRGQVLSLREQPFIEAARALGLSSPRILRRHILPNLSGTIIVFATLTVPQAILQESFLSFLGVGIQPPQATWGLLAADGVRLLNPIRVDWWLLVFPCLALSLTLLSLNFLGDALRDALDVKARGRQ